MAGAPRVVLAHCALIHARQPVDLGFIGRWVGHLFRGQIANPSIRQSPRIPREPGWGWLIHYAAGIAFAGLLVVVQGLSWTRDPALLPAIDVGVCTVVVLLLVLRGLRLELALESFEAQTPAWTWPIRCG